MTALHIISADEQNRAKTRTLAETVQQITGDQGKTGTTTAETNRIQN